MRRVSHPAVLICLLIALLTACSDVAPGGGGNAGNFPANASHPQPQEETFQGCPPGGDGGDQTLNMLKNRVDDGSYTDVDLSTLLALTWPPNVEHVSRDQWSQQDTQTVNQYEGVSVRTTGYVIAVKHEGTESTNCHAVDYRDFHVWLSTDPSNGKAQSMVVEVTPRVRDMRPGWTDTALEGLVGQQVRISGWTMLDQDHPEQIGQSRATLWEIHPILHIEVNQGGTWAGIDQ
jgi:hypothetical protein